MVVDATGERMLQLKVQDPVGIVPRHGRELNRYVLRGIRSLSRLRTNTYLPPWIVYLVKNRVRRQLLRETCDPGDFPVLPTAFPKTWKFAPYTATREHFLCCLSCLRPSSSLDPSPCLHGPCSRKLPRKLPYPTALLGDRINIRWISEDSRFECVSL